MRLRAALHRQALLRGSSPQAYETEKHVVVCGDSDAVVMALMLDPRANVTIDFGPRQGELDTEMLRQRWLLLPLLRAGLRLGTDHQIISGYTQVRGSRGSLVPHRVL